MPIARPSRCGDGADAFQLPRLAISSPQRLKPKAVPKPAQASVTRRATQNGV